MSHSQEVQWEMAYPFLNNDSMVDNSSRYILLSFMDVYFGSNYKYNMMPLGLKNTDAIYQRMMIRIFHEEICDMLEVYMDYMIVKSEPKHLHEDHMIAAFYRIRQYNLRLNPKKVMFGVKAGKILRFYIIERGIKASPDKCDAIINIETPPSK